MPPVIIGAVASTAMSFISSSFVGLGLLGNAALAGVSIGVSMLVTPKPKQRSFSSQARGITTLSRNSVESFKVIYGTRRVSGNLVYVSTTSLGKDNLSVTRTGANRFLHMVVTLAGHEVEEISTIYLDDIALTLDGSGFATNSQYVNSAGVSHIRVNKHLGSDTQNADASLVSEVTEWTTNHRLKGVAYVYARLMYTPDYFPTGIPNISAIVKGKKVYDPRTSTTIFSDNAALCIRDYITNSVYGLGANVSEVDDNSFIAAANIADENVSLKNGGSQKRYTCNGVIDTDKKPIDILGELASSSAGVIAYSQGKFALFTGAYDVPTITIDEHWLRGNISIQDRPSRKDMFNTMKGIYIEPDRYYQPTDFSPVTNSSYISEDGGDEISRNLELSFTTNQEAAQRIAKIFLCQSRQAITVEMPCNLKALQLKIWDTVQVNNTLLGWSNKVFRVAGWKLSSDGGVDLQLKEEASTSYDWNVTEAVLYDTAPDTNLPSAFDVITPGAPQISESLFVTTDGSGVKTRATISWQESGDAFVERYTVEYKLTTDSEYTLAGETSSTSLIVNDIAPGSYTFRLKARNVYGVWGNWVLSNSEIFGLTVPPADINNFSLNAIDGSAHLSWEQISDLDVRIGGQIRLRYSADTVSPTWSGAIDLTNSLAGISTSAVVPLLDGTYMVKAVDSTGNESINASLITSSITNIVNMNFVENTTQNPNFYGTLTNMIVDVSDNTLRLNGSGNFEDITGNFDDAPSIFDVILGFVSSGSYIFAETIDLGAVYTSRITGSLKALVVDPTNTFDSTANNFDISTGTFDGDEISSVNATLYVRTTDDNPLGTPTWSEWNTFFVGDYTARSYQFKIEVISSNTAHNIAISELSCTVDMPDKVQSETVHVGISGLSVTFPQKFKTTSPAIGYAIQDGNSGDYVTITNITSTGFDLIVKDNTNTATSRNINWQAKGY